MTLYIHHHIQVIFFILFLCCVVTSAAKQPIAARQEQAPVTTSIESPTVVATIPTTIPSSPTLDTEQQPLDIPIPTKIVGGKHEIPIGASLPLKGEASLIGNQIFDGMSIF